MEKWVVKYVFYNLNNKEGKEAEIEEGWEPFAVYTIPAQPSQSIIWLRKYVIE